MKAGNPEEQMMEGEKGGEVLIQQIMIAMVNQCNVGV